MNFKTTYYLFAVLGIIIVGLFLLMFLRGPDTPDSAFIFPTAHDRTRMGNEEEEKAVHVEDRITRLEIKRTHPEQKLVFVRNPESKLWELSEPAGLRINSNDVDTLVRQVLRARKERDVPSNSLKEWELDPPDSVLTLTGKDKDDKEITFTLNLGKVSPGTTSAVVYVTTSDYPKKPLAVLKSDVDHAFWKLNEFRTRDLLAETENEIKQFKIKEKDKKPIVLKNVSDNQWTFVEPAYGAADYESTGAVPGAPAGAPTGVQALLRALVDLRVSGTEPAEDKEKKDKAEEPKKSETPRDLGFVEDEVRDLAKYGLESEDKASWVIEVTRGEKKGSVTLLIGKKVEHVKEDAYYARLANSKSVVKVLGKSLEVLKKFVDNPSEVRDRDLVRLDPLKRPEAIRIENAAGTYELIREEKKDGGFPPEQWVLWRGEQSSKTDLGAVMALLSALTQKRQVKDFPEGKSDADLGLDKPEAKVWLWSSPPEKQSDDDKKAGKKPKLADAKNALQLIFGKRDRDKKTVVVRRIQGEVSTVVSVPEVLLDQVTGSSLAYMDRTIAGFGNPAEVVKLVLQHNGKTTELERKDPKDAKKGWVFKLPENMKDRSADSNAVGLILDSLNSLHADRWWTLKATEAELKQVGLQPPTTQVSVTVQGKEKEPYLYLFGKETDDKKGVYGKTGKETLVFVANPAILKTLEMDLQDLNIFQFDIKDVVGLKLTGWQDVVGEPVVRDLERKGSQTWACKSPAGLEVNGTNAELLATTLSHLRADRFVINKTGPTPDQNLDVKKGALEIEIALKDKKEPLQLLVGKLDKDKYFASSKQTPGDVFLLPRAVFEEVKKAPTYLVGPKK